MREADQAPPHSVKVKNECNFTNTPRMCLHRFVQGQTCLAKRISDITSTLKFEQCLTFIAIGSEFLRVVSKCF